MEVIGEGLKVIEEVIGDITVACSLIGISGIVTMGILIYTNKITINDIKELFKRNGSNR